ncbi:2-oxoacid:acceptor oxidoreductase subunit alpha [Methanoplanus limicola]|uniref:2-oxoacid:acceptor oxidoreductase, alpha subunit n=1 Tax=Methanoplanus limicola DSM 2279 TaxID=937775 RepID=H1YWL3_9EURY|nr:2-oxoacid:acceptor oxidoreductase subunit alpha [Methanoplanus limicola]EHQ35815.1 2-oxoacid:acceptor oxidoreductase, alpha subunit [Methanoplanus limicola DSM 2279]
MELDFSVIIGGKAGEGISSAGLTIARLFSRLGYYAYMDFDHPSLIKGGHNFSVIRASDKKTGSLRDEIDILIALDKNTVKIHRKQLKTKSILIFDSDSVKKVSGTAVPAKQIVEECSGIPVMINSCLLGAFCRTIGLEREFTLSVLRDEMPVKTEKNLEIAMKGYDYLSEFCKIPDISEISGRKKILSGNEALALGLVYAGLDAYIAYPMSPASGILHFLAGNSDNFGIKVIHPEGEIAAVLMAEGFACAGRRAATGTSGGGFCLMTEGLSYAGIAEIPLVIVLAQRQSPGTGAPTYNAQSDLLFASYAGHGEFPRFVVAPANSSQAFSWSRLAMDIAWDFQIPAIILMDRTVCEGIYTFEFDLSSAGKISENKTLSESSVINSVPDDSRYERYADSEDGISPFAPLGTKNAVVKINGKTHFCSGISTGDPEMLQWLADKREKKENALRSAVEKIKCIHTGGMVNSETALVCWGSLSMLCEEVSEKLALKFIQPVVMVPFPEKEMKKEFSGVKKIIVAEDNSTGQLSLILKGMGIHADIQILSYRGRQMTVEELYSKISEVL